MATNLTFPHIAIFVSNMKSILFGLFISLLTNCTTAQDIKSPSDIKKSFDLVVKVRIGDVDNLGRIYIVDDKNKFINYKPDLKEQYRYANTKSGSISTIDVTNPLNIIAFYDDFNQVKIFDNTLTIINEVNLSDKFVDISACGISNDGQLWIYDPSQFKLLKINENGQVILESSNVNDFGMSDVNISIIKEKSNVVILIDKSKGFYFFDNFGQYLFHFKESDILSVQFDGNQVIYFTPSGLKTYTIATKECKPVELPFEIQKTGLKFVLYQANNYYEFNHNGLNLLK